MTDTRFKPGQSGNPGGRPALPEDLKLKIRELAPKAVEALERALESKDDRIRIAAATALLDRGYGKPAQQTDLSVKTERVDTGLEHLAALMEVNQRDRDRRREARNAERPLPS